MPAAHPRIITLTTDFGLSDHYVGTMKGVILGIAPRTTIVDITHDIALFEILEGAFAIAQAFPYFPKGSIHVVVVDPGVGTARRPILVEASGQYFIGPDNGVFSMIYAVGTHRVRAISNEALFLPQLSRTFHGRDVFAPAAAHLASNAKATAYGEIINDYVHLALMTPQQTSRRVWSGTILKTDHFGNLVTNLHIDEFPDLHSKPFELSVGLRRIYGLTETFGQCTPGEPSVIIGSSGYLEVVVNQTSAASTLGCGTGTPIELTFYS
jgi:S-adenosylmethionine hydrolase